MHADTPKILQIGRTFFLSSIWYGSLLQFSLDCKFAGSRSKSYDFLIEMNCGALGLITQHEVWIMPLEILGLRIPCIISRLIWFLVTEKPKPNRLQNQSFLINLNYYTHNTCPLLLLIYSFSCARRRNGFAVCSPLQQNLDKQGTLVL